MTYLRTLIDHSRAETSVPVRVAIWGLISVVAVIYAVWSTFVFLLPIVMKVMRVFIEIFAKVQSDAAKRVDVYGRFPGDPDWNESLVRKSWLDKR